MINLPVDSKLFLIYSNGLDIEIDEQKAIASLKKGAHLGDSRCLTALAERYYFEGNNGQAVTNFMFSYKKEFQSALYLSHMHLKDEYVEKSEQFSIFYIKTYLFHNQDDEDAWFFYAKLF